jgi:hypothetical protein
MSAFDTNYLLSADEVMAIILHLAQNMDEKLPAPAMLVYDGPTPLIFAFIVVGRGSTSGCGHNPRGTRGGRGMLNKCNVFDSLNYIVHNIR